MQNTRNCDVRADVKPLRGHRFAYIAIYAKYSKLAACFAKQTHCSITIYPCTNVPINVPMYQSTSVPVYTSVPNEPVYQCTKLTSVPCTSVLGVPDDYSINIMGSVFCVTAE